MIYDKKSFLAGLRTGLALPRAAKPQSEPQPQSEPAEINTNYTDHPPVPAEQGGNHETT